MDEFEIEAVHLKDVKKLVVGHDGHEPGQGWFLNNIVVKSNIEETPMKYTFMCDRYLCLNFLSTFSELQFYLTD